MKVALFPGCKIPYYLHQYGASTQAVLRTLGVETVAIEFNCCGYPHRLLDTEAFLLSGARNLALAEAEGLDILTPCKCCFGSLQYARYWLDELPDMKDKINRLLAKEGLHWNGTIEVKHLLSMLVRDIGLAAIREKVVHPFKALNIAAHYGCHALRPSKVTQFDDPLAPTIFEQLIDVTGATSVQWGNRLECCGHPLWEINRPLSLSLMNSKLEDAVGAGADFLCVACTYCQIQFDAVQQEYLVQGNGEVTLASVLYPQLLGLSFGLDAETLGLGANKMNISELCRFHEHVHEK